MEEEQEPSNLLIEINGVLSTLEEVVYLLGNEETVPLGHILLHQAAIRLSKCVEPQPGT